MTKKEQDILKLINLTLPPHLEDEILQSIIGDQIKDPELSTIVLEEIKRYIQLEELRSMLVSVYSKAFTHKKIIEMINFYNSPTGSKLLQKMPTLLEESSMVGQKWGYEILRSLNDNFQNDTPHSVLQLNTTRNSQVSTEDKVRKARHDFVIQYIDKKSWPSPNELTVSQIMEIKSQHGWRYPSS